MGEVVGQHGDQPRIEEHPLLSSNPWPFSASGIRAKEASEMPWIAGASSRCSDSALIRRAGNLAGRSLFRPGVQGEMVGAALRSITARLSFESELGRGGGRCKPAGMPLHHGIVDSVCFSAACVNSKANSRACPAAASGASLPAATACGSQVSRWRDV